MCDCCTADRICAGHHRMHDPKCIYCGARAIQRIRKFSGTDAEAKQRKQAVLRDWVAMGHREDEIRELVKGPPAHEPVTKG